MCNKVYLYSINDDTIQLLHQHSNNSELDKYIYRENKAIKSLPNLISQELNFPSLEAFGLASKLKIQSQKTDFNVLLRWNESENSGYFIRGSLKHPWESSSTVSHPLFHCSLPVSHFCFSSWAKTFLLIRVSLEWNDIGVCSVPTSSISARAPYSPLDSPNEVEWHATWLCLPMCMCLGVCVRVRTRFLIR